MSVFVDGSTLSSLLYSHSNSIGNQEGLLLGQVINHVKDHISDSQINNSQVQTFTYVSSHIPWPDGGLYTRGGVPRQDKLAALLGKRQEEVIGWYSFRRNSSLRLSMKERTLHRSLEAAFCPNKDGQFLLFLCVETATTNRSTHSTDHFFLTIKKERVEKVAMTVSNLGDTVHSQYKTFSNSGLNQSAAVKNILHQYIPQFVAPSDEMAEVERINELSTNLNSNLMVLCKKVAESERETGTLEGEVEELRRAVAQREEEKARRAKEAELQRQAREAENLRQERETARAKVRPSAGLDTSLLPDKSDVGRAFGIERLMVDLDSSPSRQKPVPCVDLLSQPIASDQEEGGASGGAGLLQPTVHQPNSKAPPLVSQTPPLIPSAPPQATPTVFQSVVDTIADHEEAGLSSSTFVMERPCVKPAPATSRTATPTGDVPLPTTSKKPQDHFAFVGDLLSSEAESSSRPKMASVPQGGSLNNSPRATRSQVKAVPSNGSPNPLYNLNLQSAPMTRSHNANSSPKIHPQIIKREPHSAMSNTSQKSAFTEIKSESSSVKVEIQGLAEQQASNEMKVDQKSDADKGQRNRSKLTVISSKSKSQILNNGQKEGVLAQQNGGGSGMEDDDWSINRSSSPVF